ncbi:MAG: type II toxin-antitoxin system VapC family toxin [Burkholderiales bacterium]|nr:MAG: type II toxin-antitoxin system VapC family toxin [Burkholderiales bacterium]
MYLLDTNVVSELRRRDRTDVGVAAWVDGIDPGALFVSVVTILELEMGVLAVERRDPTQGALLRRWLEERVLPAFDERILPIDLQVARRCARLHVPDRRAERDALIAATALRHTMTVVTRNVEDFAPMQVTLINPWASTGAA